MHQDPSSWTGTAGDADTLEPTRKEIPDGAPPDPRHQSTLRARRMSTAGPSEDPRLPEPLEWLFRDRRTGRFTVAQAPNLPLVVFAARR